MRSVEPLAGGKLGSTHTSRGEGHECILPFRKETTDDGRWTTDDGRGEPGQTDDGRLVRDEGRKTKAVLDRLFSFAGASGYYLFLKAGPHGLSDTRGSQPAASLRFGLEFRSNACNYWNNL